MDLKVKLMKYLTKLAFVIVSPSSLILLIMSLAFGIAMFMVVVSAFLGYKQNIENLMIGKEPHIRVDLSQSNLTTQEIENLSKSILNSSKEILKIKPVFVKKIKLDFFERLESEDDFEERAENYQYEAIKNNVIVDVLAVPYLSLSTLKKENKSAYNKKLTQIICNNSNSYLNNIALIDNGSKITEQLSQILNDKGAICKNENFNWIEQGNKYKLLKRRKDFLNYLSYMQDPYFDENFHNILSDDYFIYHFGGRKNYTIVTQSIAKNETSLFLKKKTCTDSMGKNCYQEIYFSTTFKDDLVVDIAVTPKIIMSQRHSCKIFSKCDVNMLYITLKNPFEVEGLTQKLNILLGKRGAKVKSWVENNENTLSFLLTQKQVILFIFCLIILIIAFSMSSMMFLTIMRKKSHIAILKAVGATKAKVQNMFLIVAILISLLGSTLVFLGLYNKRISITY